MNQMKTNRTRLMLHQVQILLLGAAGQSFGKANRPIIIRPSIPLTIRCTGTTGAAGQSYMCTAPVHTEQRHLRKLRQTANLYKHWLHKGLMIAQQAVFNRVIRWAFDKRVMCCGSQLSWYRSSHSPVRSSAAKSYWLSYNGDVVSPVYSGYLSVLLSFFFHICSQDLYSNVNLNKISVGSI